MQLAPEEARCRFAAAPVARLATADARGVPHLVPVTFALELRAGVDVRDEVEVLDGARAAEAAGPPAAEAPGPHPRRPPLPACDLLYFAVDHKPKRTTALRRLRNITENPRVCLLADHYGTDWARLWWARADGVARIVEDPEGRARPVDLLRAAYPQYREHPPRGPVVAVTVTRWSGWASADPKVLAPKGD